MKVEGSLQWSQDSAASTQPEADTYTLRPPILCIDDSF